MPTGTGLPLCHESICRGGSCQEHRGIMFLMAIPVALCLQNSGSQTPDCWLKLDRNTHSSSSISDSPTAVLKSFNFSPSVSLQFIYITSFIYTHKRLLTHYTAEQQFVSTGISISVEILIFLPQILLFGYMGNGLGF